MSTMLEIIPAGARDGTNLDLWQGGFIQDTTNVLIMLKNEMCTDWSYIHVVHSLKPCASLSHTYTTLASVIYPLAVKRAISNCFSTNRSTFPW